MPQKTALVTGATGLLGRQVVKAFEASGWTVKGTGFSRANGTTVLKVDLGSPADVEKALDETRSVLSTCLQLHRHLNIPVADTLPPKQAQCCSPL